MPNKDVFSEKLQSLISKFEKDKSHYLSKGYPEAQVRIDFPPCIKKLNAKSPSLTRRLTILFMGFMG